jgi:hypothetical protein
MRRGCPTGIESGRNFFARAGINEILPQAQFYVSSKDLVTSKGLTTRMDELGSADAAKSSTGEPHICAPGGGKGATAASRSESSVHDRVRP